MVGKTFPKSGEIFAKQIIPRMIYRATIENENTQVSLNWAEKQMKQVVSE